MGERSNRSAASSMSFPRAAAGSSWRRLESQRSAFLSPSPSGTIPPRSAAMLFLLRLRNLPARAAAGHDRSVPPMNASAAPPNPDRPPRHGLAAALAAYVAWGCFPLYFKSIRSVPPLQILSHRVVWSLLFLALLVSWKRRWPELRGIFADGQLPTYLLTTLLISANWLIFIWAVNGGRVLEASLGYFVNPLVNVLLGVLFLRERLSRKQGAAVALAGLGVLALVIRLGVFPWVSLALAQFLQAVLLFREPFTMSHGIAFGCIWASLALYTFDAVRTRHPSQPAEPALD